MLSNFDGVIEEEDPDSGLVEDAFDVDVLPDEQTLPFDEIDFDFDFDNDGNLGRCSTGEDFSDLLELDGLDTSLTELEDNVFGFETSSDDRKNKQDNIKCIKDTITNNATDIIVKLPYVNNNIELEESVYSANNDDDKSVSDSVDSGVFTEETDNFQPNKESLTNNSTSDKVSHEINKNSGKLVSFSKEQARQWRRKRILNSCNKKEQKLPVIGLKFEEQHKTSQKCPLKLEPLLPLPKDLKPMVPAKIKQNHGKTNPVEKLENPLLGGERLGTKTKRGPVPMKLRALPESFWKEPTSIQTGSIGANNYAVLPPLFSLEGKNSDVTSIRPVTPPDDKKNSPRHSPRSKKKIVATATADRDLLFSLFDHLETNKIDQKLIVRRGRPKKSTTDKVPPPPSRTMEEDPYVVDDLADKLFPELSLNHQKNNNKTPAPNYAMVRIKRGPHTIEFPAIKACENYGTILNELVTHM